MLALAACTPKLNELSIQSIALEDVICHNCAEVQVETCETCDRVDIFTGLELVFPTYSKFLEWPIDIGYKNEDQIILNGVYYDYAVADLLEELDCLKGAGSVPDHEHPADELPPILELDTTGLTDVISDVDSWAEPVIATEAGTDFYGNEYEEGAQLYINPAGDTICVPGKDSGVEDQLTYYILGADTLGYIYTDVDGGTPDTVLVSAPTSPEDSVIPWIDGLTGDTLGFIYVDNDGGTNDTIPFTKVVDEVDLWVDKQPVEGGPFTNGDTILWEVNYGNNGPDKDMSATLFDAIPEGTSLVINGANPSAGVYDSNNGSIYLGCVDPGVSSTVTFVLVIDDISQGIINTASIIGSCLDTDPSNNTDTEVIEVPAVDLSIEKYTFDDISDPGDTVTFTIKYCNNSDIDVNDAIISEPSNPCLLPISTGTSCSYDPGLQVINVGFIGAQSCDSCDIVFVQQCDIPSSNSVTINSPSTIDTVLVNDMAADTTGPLPPKDLAIQSKSAPAEAMIDGGVPYTIVYCNDGTTVIDGTTGCTITDTPSLSEYLYHPEEFDPATGIYTISDTLLIGECDSFTVVMRMEAGTFSNTVTAGDDEDGGNNTASASVTDCGPCDCCKDNESNWYQNLIGTCGVNTSPVLNPDQYTAAKWEINCAETGLLASNVIANSVSPLFGHETLSDIGSVFGVTGNSCTGELWYGTTQLYEIESANNLPFLSSAPWTRTTIVSSHNSVTGGTSLVSLPDPSTSALIPGITDIEYNENTGNLLANNTSDGGLYCVDPSTGNILSSYFHGGSPSIWGTSPDELGEPNTIWGHDINYCENRLYYTIGGHVYATGTTPSGLNANTPPAGEVQLWSIALDASGCPTGSPTQEISNFLVPSSTQNGMDVAIDVEFNDACNIMAVVGHGGAHYNDTEIFTGSTTGTWTHSAWFNAGRDFNQPAGGAGGGNSRGGAEFYTACVEDCTGTNTQDYLLVGMNLLNLSAPVGFAYGYHGRPISGSGTFGDRTLGATAANQMAWDFNSPSHTAGDKGSSGQPFVFKCPCDSCP